MNSAPSIIWIELWRFANSAESHYPSINSSLGAGVARVTKAMVKGLLARRDFRQYVRDGLLTVRLMSNDPRELTALRVIKLRIDGDHLIAQVRAVGPRGGEAIDTLLKSAKAAARLTGRAQVRARLHPCFISELGAGGRPVITWLSINPVLLNLDPYTSTRKVTTMTETTKKPSVKQVFRDVKPVVSKNVVVHFDNAFRVSPRSKFDGYMKKLGDRMGVFVRVPGHGDDIFAVPYSCPVGVRSQQMEGSLRGALRTRKLEVVRIDDLKPKKK